MKGDKIFCVRCCTVKNIWIIYPLLWWRSGLRILESVMAIKDSNVITECNNSFVLYRFGFWDSLKTPIALDLNSPWQGRWRASSEPNTSSPRRAGPRSSLCWRADSPFLHSYQLSAPYNHPFWLWAVSTLSWSLTTQLSAPYIKFWGCIHVILENLLPTRERREAWF